MEQFRTSLTSGQIGVAAPISVDLTSERHIEVSRRHPLVEDEPGLTVDVDLCVRELPKLDLASPQDTANFVALAGVLTRDTSPWTERFETGLDEFVPDLDAIQRASRHTVIVNWAGRPGELETARKGWHLDD